MPVRQAGRDWPGWPGALLVAGMAFGFVPAMITLAGLAARSRAGVQ